MEYKTTTTYPIGYAICNHCKKDIIVAEGHYHCDIDKIDIHSHCVTKAQPKFVRMKSKIGKKLMDDVSKEMNLQMTFVVSKINSDSGEETSRQTSAR